MSDKRTDLEVIEDIAHEVITEREDQLAQWGRQDHPSIFGGSQRRRFEREADAWKAVNAARVIDGVLTWDGILLEEVYEALAEEGEEARRAELIQVAAVAMAEIEAIDRRLAKLRDMEEEMDRLKAEEAEELSEGDE